MDQILKDISEQLQKGKMKDVKALVSQAIEQGIAADVILNDGLLYGMNIVGEKFEKAEGTDVSSRIEKNVTEFLSTL